MKCQQAREVLWPPERPRLVDPLTADARKHVEGCEACASWLAQDRAIIDAYATLRQQRTPQPIRERVFDALARERAARPTSDDAARMSEFSPVRRAVGVAALLLLTGVGLILGFQAYGSGSTGSATDAALVQDYIRRAVGEDRLTTSNPHEISRFLMRELGIMVRPASIDGLRVTGVEVCLLDGQRAAMIRYSYRDQELAHYIIPGEATGERSPALSVPRDQTRPGSPSVVSWSRGAFEEALVADVDPALLMQLASRMPSGT